MNRGAAVRAAALLALTAVAGVSPALVARVPAGSLLPWIGLVAAAATLPVLLARRLDLFEPATFAVWVHFGPAFVVGSLLLALGFVDYPFLWMLPHPVPVLASTLVLTAAGLAALALGARSAAAASAGRALSARLPRLEAGGRDVGPLGIAVAALVGIAGSLVAFRHGLIGYQSPGVAPWTGVAGYYLSSCLSLAHFLFWFRLFRSARRVPAWAYLFPLLIVVYTIVLWGNRGAVLSCYLVAAFAFRLARGPLPLKTSVAVALLSFVALGAGMAFGSALRAAKGGESPVPPEPAAPAPAQPAPTPAAPAQSAAPDSAAPPAPPAKAESTEAVRPPGGLPAAGRPSSVGVPVATFRPGALDQQLRASRRAVATLATSRLGSTAQAVLRRIAERLDLLSHASVTVARAAELRPLERAAGVSSVGEALLSGLVPRVLWPEKPRASDARAYARLYFGWGGNSFAVTFPADVFRSWGPWAVVPALALLGALLRFLSAALVEGAAPPDAGRAALWALLILAVPWEGFYGLVVPVLLRAGAVAVLGLLLVAAASSPRLSRRSRMPRGPA